MNVDMDSSMAVLTSFVSASRSETCVHDVQQITRNEFKGAIVKCEVS